MNSAEWTKVSGESASGWALVLAFTSAVHALWLTNPSPDQHTLDMLKHSMELYSHSPVMFYSIFRASVPLLDHFYVSNSF